MARPTMEPEDRQVRMDAILQAARRLFLAGDGSLPATAKIAAASGLAKGTLYLYFRTREEIFIALLLDGLNSLFDEVEGAFGKRKGSRREKVAAFLNVYCDFATRRTDMLRLDALAYSILEKNVPGETLLQFKRNFAGRLLQAGAVIETTLALDAGRGATLLMRTFALTRGLWPAAECPARIETQALLHPEFATELKEALTEYWRGALALR